MKPRADKHAVVPAVEFTSYYGRNIVQPAPWGPEVPAYIFLGGLAGGSGLIGAAADLAGLTELRRNARLTAVAAAAVGGAFLVKDLGRPERFLNMVRTIKPTSPMSMGSWILAGFSGFAGAGAGFELLGSRVARDGLPGRALALAGPAASVGSATFGGPLAAYTAVLLADTATPLWHAAYRELPFLFTASGLSAAAGTALVTTGPQRSGPVSTLAPVAAVAELGAYEVLQRRLGDLGQPLKEGRARTHDLAAKGLTIAGAVGSVLGRRSRVVSAVSGLALAAGSACTRFAIVEAGKASARDPRYTVVPQRERVAAREAEGKGVAQPGGPWPAG